MGGGVGNDPAEQQNKIYTAVSKLTVSIPISSCSAANSYRANKLQEKLK